MQIDAAQLQHSALEEPTRAAKPIWNNWYQISFRNMPKQYMHHVHSRPTKVSEDVWRQWYDEERSRDMVYFNVSSTAAFYEAMSECLTYNGAGQSGTVVGDSGASKVEGMKFLAYYQMGPTLPRYMDEYQKNVRTSSALWEQGKTCFNVAEFASSHLELVEILGSYEHNEAVAPFIIHARITGEEVEAKLQFEHINVVSCLEGYRRSLLYRPIDRKTETISYVILIHEFESRPPDDLTSVREGMEKIEPSQDCAFQLRAFKLLGSEGFESGCRTPERLST